MKISNIKHFRFKCVNCGFVFESYKSLCNKCSSNACDLVEKPIKDPDIKWNEIEGGKSSETT